MTEKFFTLTEDCMFEKQQLNEGDILLIFPTANDVDEVIEFLEEAEIDYSGLMSVYIYSRQDFTDAVQKDEWIFCREPKHDTFIESDWLPDFFFDLPIRAVEIDFGEREDAAAEAY